MAVIEPAVRSLILKLSCAPSFVHATGGKTPSISSQRSSVKVGTLNHPIAFRGFL